MKFEDTGLMDHEAVRKAYALALDIYKDLAGIDWDGLEDIDPADRPTMEELLAVYVEDDIDNALILQECSDNPNPELVAAAIIEQATATMEDPFNDPDFMAAIETVLSEPAQAVLLELFQMHANEKPSVETLKDASPDCRRLLMTAAMVDLARFNVDLRDQIAGMNLSADISKGHAAALEACMFFIDTYAGLDQGLEQEADEIIEEYKSLQGYLEGTKAEVGASVSAPRLH